MVENGGFYNAIDSIQSWRNLKKRGSFFVDLPCTQIVVMSFRGNNYECRTGIYVQYSVLLLSILIDKQYPDHAFLQFDRGLTFYTVK